ncbi:MAG: DUF4830 domain-containing protein [Clostridia bacterium]|nr:DUF4830 domain-containing protein [Clostridia bacterium]
MFVYSVRAGTVLFFGVICAALLLLVALVAFVPELSPVAAATEPQEQIVRYEGVENEQDAGEFLAQFGWEIEPAAVESTTVTIPAEFDKVFAAYNELQRAQGLDLSSYAGRVVRRYTYRVTNYEGYTGEVLANLLVFRDRVIGGDICAADANGFLQGFEKTN